MIPVITREEAATADEGMLFLDGLDAALVGVVRQFGRPAVALYDYTRVLAVLKADFGMDDDGAREFFETNLLGASVGEYTPAFLNDRVPA